MKAFEIARLVLAGALVAGTIGVLVTSPVSFRTFVIFAAMGIIVGGLFVPRQPIAAWIGGAILIFGTEWVQSLLAVRGVDFPWYAPAMIVASFCVIAVFAGRAVRTSRKTRRAP
jgi:ABC-type branched-subunit amino acid transport system permease subunit